MSSKPIYFRKIIPKAKMTDLVSCFVLGRIKPIEKADYDLYADYYVSKFYMRKSVLHIFLEKVK